MKFDVPLAYGRLEGWARDNDMSIVEARRRFVQGSVLYAIGVSARLRRTLVFKGGNALDFVWHSQRSTLDLDFSTRTDPRSGPDWSAGFQTLFQDALKASERRFGITLRLQRWEVFPKATDDPEFAAIDASVGYALPDQPSLRARMDLDRPSSQIIPIDISINDPIMESLDIPIDRSVTITTASLDDVIAEKLRALLQQPSRRRNRPQDVLDLASMLRAHAAEVDSGKIARFLVAKASARGIDVSKRAFDDEIVGLRASTGYAELEQSMRGVFIPFDKAFAVLRDYVDSLEIPD